MATCIQVKNVRYRYPEGQEALTGIDFAIDEGDYLLICGANGSGKSTIGYLLNGLIPHFFSGNFSGTVEISGMDTRNMSISELFPRVGLVLQNADAQLFNSSVEDELAFGLESLGLSGKEIEERIRETAELLHIDPLLKRSPDTLSGGEKRMAGIASILCLKPAILILDEPYANLDGSGITKVRECLGKIYRMGLTLVVIEQRVDGFLEDASRCLIVEQGKIIFNGKAAHAGDILVSQGLIPRYPDRRKLKNFTKAMSYDAEKPLLRVRNLSCQINGKKILNDLSFDIFKGQAVALLGKNGSGKTTLIKHLNGLYRSKQGEIHYNGQSLTGKTPAQIATMVGLSFQNPNDQFFKSRVEDELRVGLQAVQKEPQEWLEKICRLFQLQSLLDRPPFKLSEGEKKRVAIGSILAMKPEMIVLDEPSAGLDGRSKQMLAAMLAELVHEGFTTICITHDIGFARAVADRWIVLDKGQIAGDGPPESLEQIVSLVKII
ncbi:MAG: energy-coupling factor ABC transporter ATP-binding protein [Desulfobacterales bacterium]|nr:energy-coupling factor ABC transporter ATP-binding protein [Desulfobacterales bacterium]